MKGRTWIIGEKGEVEITYGLSGRLREIIFSDDATDKQVDWIFNVMAIKGNDIEDVSEFMKGLSSKIKIKEVPADISFDRFWSEYEHKVGKMEAEKSWSRTSKDDKLKALTGIRKYKAFSSHKKYDLAYPAKYLNKQLYNDFQ